MFQLSLIEHVRLSFGSAVNAYEGHAEAAGRLSVWTWYTKIATLCLVAAAAILSVVALQRGRAYQIAGAAAASASLIAAAAYVAFDPQTRIYGHRASAARLWLICEKYRALLAEVRDELIDLPAVKERRDGLLKEFAEVLEQGPPADRDTYRIAGHALAGAHGTGYSDAELDKYLPPSLRGLASAPRSSADSAA